MGAARPLQARRAAAAGFSGALAACGLQAALRFTAGGLWVAELMAQRLFAAVPMGLFELAVGLWGAAAKWVALGAMVVLYGVLGAAAGVALVRVAGRRALAAARGGLLPAASALGLAAGVGQWLLVSFLLDPLQWTPQLSGPLVGPAGRLASDWASGALYAAVLLRAAR